MDIITQGVDFFLHLDTHLQTIIATFGNFTYLILFLIVFAETGLVVIPLLPGDSLLFIVGALSGTGHLNFFLAYVLLLAAAIIGDTVNYWMGHHFGKRVFTKENSRLFNKTYIEKTREFFVKHGGKTIILARFIPIIRTFAPFVAGMGNMDYKTFLSYNVIGGFVWVTSLMLAGYFLGSMDIVKNNFETAIYVIIFISLIPVFVEVFRSKFGKEKTNKHAETTSYEEVQGTFEKEHLK